MTMPREREPDAMLTLAFLSFPANMDAENTLL
jgi:hypothetical protein